MPLYSVDITSPEAQMVAYQADLISKNMAKVLISQQKMQPVVQKTKEEIMHSYFHSQPINVLSPEETRQVVKDDRKALCGVLVVYMTILASVLFLALR